MLVTFDESEYSKKIARKSNGDIKKHILNLGDTAKK